MPSPSTVARFSGLNSSNDALEQGLAWLRTADNVDITNTGKLERRDGYSKVLAAVPSGAFATKDFSRLFLVDAGSLLQVNADLSTRVLKTGLTAAPMQWAEHNKQVFFTNGIDSGIILSDGNVLDWAWQRPYAIDLAAVSGNQPAGQYQVTSTFLLPDGRETGAGPVTEITLAAGQGLQLSNIQGVAGLRTLVYIAPANSQVFGFAFVATASAATWNGNPNSLGTDLTTLHRYPLPAGATLPTSWNGRLCAASYLAAKDVSYVWLSDPLAPHLFELERGFFAVPGEVLLLAPTDKGLLVGTRSHIYLYGDDKSLNDVADYGCVPGYPWAADGPDGIVFWTTRGMCSAMPFVNHTEQNVSVAPGLSAGVALLQRGGSKTFVACLQSGGTPFNAHP